MKAIQIHTYGNPDVLIYEDAPRPEPQADQVLIRVHAAGVNPADWKIRRGYLQDKLPFSMPLILGYDVAGVIEAIDYKIQRFEDHVSNVDVALATIGKETRTRSWQVLKSGGILVSTEGAAEPVESPNPEIRGVPIFAEPKDPAQLQQIGQLIDQGQIQPPTVEALPLAKAAEVHNALQNQHRRGRFVLQVV